MPDADLWGHIHTERNALAGRLAELTAEQWQADSLCPGWTVKDVAAHIISNPQIGWRQLPAMTARNLGRGYNTMVFREVKRLAATQTPETILADFETFASSRRHVPVTTTTEPLVDGLVHTQDILRPLGIAHEAAPEAAAIAADRCRLLSGLMGSRRVIRAVRMVASDVDWARGRGPVVEAPIGELLMLCAGRRADAARVTGPGRDRVPLV